MVFGTLRERVLEMEEAYLGDSPWSSIYRLEALVKKCGRPGCDSTFENLSWALNALHDRIRNKAIQPSDCNVRALSGKGQPSNKGLVDFCLFQLSVKHHAEAVILPTFKLDTDVIGEMKALWSCHDEYRKKNRQLPHLDHPPVFATLYCCTAEAHIVHW